MAYTLNQLIVSFLEHWQYVKKRSPETTRNYELYLRRFQKFSKLSSPKGIISIVITNYKRYLRTTTFEEKHLSSSTINYHLIALRNFLKYLQLHSIAIQTDKKIKLANYKPEHRLVPTKFELQRLLKAPSKSLRDSELIRLRDQAVLAVMIDSGLKVALISQLQKNDLHGSYLKIENKKSAILGRETQVLIKAYITTRLDKNSYLFIPHDRAQITRGKNSKPMTPRSLQRLVKKYVSIAGITRPITADSFTKVGNH